MLCPNCHKIIDEDAVVCENCDFDIKLYQETYNKLYYSKLNLLNKRENEISSLHNKTVEQSTSNTVHKPRCPYCNSDNLTRITSLDRAVNIAMFGLLE